MSGGFLAQGRQATGIQAAVLGAQNAPLCPIAGDQIFTYLLKMGELRLWRPTARSAVWT